MRRLSSFSRYLPCATAPFTPRRVHDVHVHHAHNGIKRNALGPQPRSRHHPIGARGNHKPWKSNSGCCRLPWLLLPSACGSRSAEGMGGASTGRCSEQGTRRELPRRSHKRARPSLSTAHIDQFPVVAFLRGCLYVVGTQRTTHTGTTRSTKHHLGHQISSNSTSTVGSQDTARRGCPPWPA